MKSNDETRMMPVHNLGQKVKDTITGVTGTVVGYGVCMNGTDPNKAHPVTMVDLDQPRYLDNRSLYISTVVYHPGNLEAAS